MEKLEIKDLLEAGVHFGHLSRKWDPAIAPYIFMEKNGIHFIDLNKSMECLENAAEKAKAFAHSGRKIMFVATKKQATEIVKEEAMKVKMPYVTERWQGGMLTNFFTIRKSLKKLAHIDKMVKDTAYKNLAKREKLMLSREADKMRKVLGGMMELNRLPSALFVIDIKNEHLAISEARKMNIPVIAIVDTNSNPNLVDYPIPANDDAFKSIQLITKYIRSKIEEGIQERKKEQESISVEKDKKETTDLKK